MKSYKLFLLIILGGLARLQSQTNASQLFGKWQNTSLQQSDGVHSNKVQIKNGEIFSFEPNGVVRDSAGTIGSYELEKNTITMKLKEYKGEFEISFSKDGEYFNWYPTHLLCIEGCHFTFTRLKK